MARYTVTSTEDGRTLGAVDIDAQGMLHVVEGGTPLQKAAADLNGRDALVLKLPPAPTEDDKDFQPNQKLKIPRSDPAFFKAIEDNLGRWHEMQLTPG